MGEGGGVKRGAALGLLIGVLLLVGCGSRPVVLTDFLPGAGDLAGWEPVGEVRVFNRDNLYDLVNGQAESFFAYGFEQVAVRDYQNAAGAMLGIEVWRLATPADAYGLFTVSVAGEPAAVGNDGDSDPGRRLAFWQDRYYVQVRARQAVDDTTIRSFATAVAAKLPPGGNRPALLNRLPPEGLVERSVVFFHEEISILDVLWLGGENVLGLNSETDGVLARYEVGGAVVQLLLVQYPATEAASAGLAALERAQISGLVMAEARDNLLGAVFGELEEAAAGTLLAEALGAPASRASD
ncbi:MAG: hypothetical protein H5T62_09170 [Anaerolineae bacterium]|nr:hypothetical protein [Anaerolineae bacterium]